MKIPKDRNIAFKVKSASDFLVVKNYIEKYNFDRKISDLKLSDLKLSDSENFIGIWIYLQINIESFGWDYLRNVKDPKDKYKQYTYVIIEFNRKEKLNRILGE